MRFRFMLRLGNGRYSFLKHKIDAAKLWDLGQLCLSYYPCFSVNMSLVIFEAEASILKLLLIFLISTSSWATHYNGIFSRPESRVTGRNYRYECSASCQYDKIDLRFKETGKIASVRSSQKSTQGEAEMDLVQACQSRCVMDKYGNSGTTNCKIILCSCKIQTDIYMSHRDGGSYTNRSTPARELTCKIPLAQATPRGIQPGILNEPELPPVAPVMPPVSVPVDVCARYTKIGRVDLCMNNRLCGWTNFSATSGFGGCYLKHGMPCNYYNNFGVGSCNENKYCSWGNSSCDDK